MEDLPGSSFVQRSFQRFASKEIRLLKSLHKKKTNHGEVIKHGKRSLHCWPQGMKEIVANELGVTTDDPLLKTAFLCSGEWWRSGREEKQKKLTYRTTGFHFQGHMIKPTNLGGPYLEIQGPEGQLYLQFRRMLGIVHEGEEKWWLLGYELEEVSREDPEAPLWIELARVGGGQIVVPFERQYSVSSCPFCRRIPSLIPTLKVVAVLCGRAPDGEERRQSKKRNHVWISKILAHELRKENRTEMESQAEDDLSESEEEEEEMVWR